MTARVLSGNNISRPGHSALANASGESKMDIEFTLKQIPLGGSIVNAEGVPAFFVQANLTNQMIHEQIKLVVERDAARKAENSD